MQNIAELLRNRAEISGDKPLVRFEDEVISWSEFYRRATRLADLLKTSGVKKNDTVCIYLPHSLGQAIALFAVAIAEARFSIINPLLKDENIKFQLKDCEAVAVISSGLLSKKIQDILENREVSSINISTNGLIDESQNKNPEYEIISAHIPSDVANIIYTSGSVGRPKGVVLPHRTLLDGARIVSGYLDISERDRILSILPFGFDYGLNQLLSAVKTGAYIHIFNYILPSDLLNILESDYITALAVVPSIWAKLLTEENLKGRKYENLRYVTTAGGFHSQELLKKITEFLPYSEIIVMYGLTESFRSTYLPFSEIFKRPGSIGKAVPEVDILVMNEKGDVCKSEERGELVHRGAFVSYGYLNNKDLTEQKFKEFDMAGEGCLSETVVYSGDLVSKDEDGFIYYHGRMDTQIKSNGFRVCPDEISEVIESVEGVRLAAVFGVDDENVGQAIHVVYESVNEKVIDQSIFDRKVRELLPSYCIPKDIKFYKTIPLNQNGKIDFNKLKYEAGR